MALIAQQITITGKAGTMVFNLNDNNSISQNADIVSTTLTMLQGVVVEFSFREMYDLLTEGVTLSGDDWKLQPTKMYRTE